MDFSFSLTLKMNKFSKNSLDFAPSKMHIKMQTLWSLKQSSWSKDHLTVQNPMCEGEVLQAVLCLIIGTNGCRKQYVSEYSDFRRIEYDTSYRLLLTLGRPGNKSDWIFAHWERKKLFHNCNSASGKVEMLHRTCQVRWHVSRPESTF